VPQSHGPQKSGSGKLRTFGIGEGYLISQSTAQFMFLRRSTSLLAGSNSNSIEDKIYSFLGAGSRRDSSSRDLFSPDS